MPVRSRAFTARRASSDLWFVVFLFRFHACRFQGPRIVVHWRSLCRSPGPGFSPGGFLRRRWRRACPFVRRGSPWWRRPDDRRPDDRRPDDRRREQGRR
jgi:hypothetical protein